MESHEDAVRALRKTRFLGAAVGGVAAFSIVFPLLSDDYPLPQLLGCAAAVLAGGRLGMWVGFLMWSSVLRFARGWSKEQVEAARLSK
jgi:hypothetical protein